ncbi:alpha/beta hydrolase [Sphingomonas sp. ZT3P38]|uniref:alpha/beta hydrolase n=1 Tax=Parasphingomonas zepuensis TaxID=3096161 RepID=UPI002FC6B60D
MRSPRTARHRISRPTLPPSTISRTVLPWRSLPWRSPEPSYYLVATEDHMVPPTAQRSMARRSGATIAEIRSSHAVMMSHPDEVALFIEAADGSRC